MNDIELPEQQGAIDELNSFIEQGEDLLRVKPTNVALDEHLQDLIHYLACTPRMMEIAASLYSKAKGVAAEEAMANSKMLAAKQDVQRNWLTGKLSRFEALYQKTERLKKSIDSAIDGYRTLISYEKEQLKKT